MVKMPHWPVPIWHLPKIKMDKLTRVEELLESVGNPMLKMPPIIHVAGTNGKGSTIAFLRAILEDAGYVVHSYSSPHLKNFNERINVAGAEISDNELYLSLEKCRIASEKNNVPVTFFEGTTVAAFLSFAKFPADICLIETGLGGRLDATNVIKEPIMTIISSISYDHQEFLGETLKEIASEKAGILKKNSLNIISSQYEEVISVFEEKANELGIENFIFEYDFIITPEGGGKFKYKDQNHEITLPEPSLKGNHQLINASTAIAASLNLDGFEISAQNIANGLQKAKWPARLQKISSGAIYLQLQEISPNFELWLDGAHNIGGAHVLSNWLESEDGYVNFALCGTTKGKDFIKMLTLLKEQINFIYGSTVEGEQSSYDGEYISEMSKIAGIDSRSVDGVSDIFPDLKERVVNFPKDQKFKLVIFGSLYLAELVI